MAAPPAAKHRDDPTGDMNFGFNRPEFSDRILRVQINPDPPEPKPDTPGLISFRIRRRINWAIGPGKKRTNLTCLSLGKKTNKRSSLALTFPPRVMDLHINSLVLASKSSFFYKMFSNGMRESKQHLVTLSIYASEETALMDLIQFTYKNNLEACKPADLLKVLMLADKYQVISCVECCVRKLLALPLTFELAVSCVNLPSSAIQVDSYLQPLVEAGTSFISKNFGMHFEEALNLPLETVESILSWDTLSLFSEDQVYDFVLKWARTHYQDLKERRQVFRSRLCPLVRFSYMSFQKLLKVLKCKELDQVDAAKKVLETLIEKVSDLHLSRVQPSSAYPKRDYNLQPVKMMSFESPHQQGIVYLELRKKECETLDDIFTEPFSIGNRRMFLRYMHSKKLNAVILALYADRLRSSHVEFKVEWEIAVMLKATGKYVTKKVILSRLKDDIPGRYILDESWESFIGENAKYFINGAFHARFTITLQHDGK